MKYLVLGASAAGLNGADTLRKLDKNAEIVLISEDKEVYSKCILHHYLEGIRDIEQLNFKPINFFEERKIKWIKGKKVVHLNSKEKSVILDDGKEIHYDKILVATGSKPFIPPIKNFREAKNVIGLRTLEDCYKIKEVSKEAKNIVVIGAGLIGMDALTGLLHCGAKLSLVEMQSHILFQQLDKFTAKTYENKFIEAGVSHYYDNAVLNSVMDEKKNIISLELKTGEILPVDLVIVAAGVRANVEFLENSGVDVGCKGLLVDEHGKTNINSVFGAGDVTGLSPIWPAAVKESIVAASNMAGKKMEMTDFFASKTTMNFFNIPTMSIGNVSLHGDGYIIEVEHDKNGNYKKIIHKDGKIYGAILQGDLSYSGILTQLIKNKINISKVKKPIFKIDYSDFFHTTEDSQFEF
ncbi:NAD(P)/FAD-dependent oxidoreductase [Cetobacterium sp. 2A]|uniref:NAD(P)/FAD-dependent oxidoreductase n=1 Tax=unclassified Cetobacterium TaxID=2630983 RepID=UPI00163CB8E8|nr:FAD-dependent oxidoreductase [Cetobacterium sp. 2A]MBC2855137.1 NAD(P)/FAD-dependent oxidoreductase [Cetobacterium sp. 2A]